MPSEVPVVIVSLDELEAAGMQLTSESPGLLEGMVEEEGCEKVRRALEKLSPRQSQAVCLCFYAGYTWSDAAHLMGISPSTFETHMRRAFQHLRRDLYSMRWTTA